MFLLLDQGVQAHGVCDDGRQPILAIRYVDVLERFPIAWTP